MCYTAQAAVAKISWIWLVNRSLEFLEVLAGVVVRQISSAAPILQVRTLNSGPKRPRTSVGKMWHMLAPSSSSVTVETESSGLGRK